MIAIRPAAERFHTDLGWLDSRHTFSFGEHYDPRFEGFRALRVINEDRVRPGRGFGTHGHRDMDILSYVLEGELGHQDSMGNGSVIRPGEVQRMSAGTGVEHSEKNPSSKEPVHFLQIWIIPEEEGLKPSYEQKLFPAEERKGKLRLIAAPGGREGAVALHQDVALYSALLDQGDSVEHALAAGRHGWLQVARGAVELNGKPLAQGDGAAITQENKLSIRATAPSEVLLFDLA